MKTNSHSEIILELLHKTKAILLHDGFVSTPLPKWQACEMESGTLNETLSNIQARYAYHLALGSSWPDVKGTHSPKAVIICQKELSDRAKDFVRRWFENPKVGLQLQEDCFIQPLPCFAEKGSVYTKYFDELLSFLKPQVVLSLGEVPAQLLLEVPASLETLRGGDYLFSQFPLVTTLDPELFFDIHKEEQESQKTFKAKVWQDIQRIVGKIHYA